MSSVKCRFEGSRQVHFFKDVISHRGIEGLTELHADVLIGVFLPELLILVFVTHEREDDLLANSLEEIKVPIRSGGELQWLKSSNMDENNM